MNKLAFVIGNNAYPEAPLKNPVNDANSMVERLVSLGFRVIVMTNATIKEMEDRLRIFLEQLPGNEVGLFFFAGHGMQIDGKNYLTAVDTNFDTELDAKYSSLHLDKVIDVLEKTIDQTKIVILDACRNNPYERRWRGISETQGLAPIYAPRGMIIAYATSPGQVAFDGLDKNGAYTKALLQHISTQDIAIEELFKRVRNSLSSSTKGKQISWEHTSLMGDFYFNYSIASNDLVTEYSNSALSDRNFHPTDTVIREIIESLKSHNWYAQNPAVQKFRSLDLNSVGKDALFVIGRNLYQAACGSAARAVAYLENLKAQLLDIETVVAFHILNGILFEIYFDSWGRKRNIGKTDLIDSVFSLEGIEQFFPSFDFICQALKPHHRDLFYVPGKQLDVNVDITTIKDKSGRFVVSGVFYKGENVFYDEDGKFYFEPTPDTYFITKSNAGILEILSRAMITPSYRIKINYVDVDNSLEATFLFPVSSKIQRYSKG